MTHPTDENSTGADLRSVITSFPWLLVLAVLLLGFAIFMVDLTKTGLWADEGWTIAASAEPTPLHVITEWVANDVHPPLFFMELNLWRKFTGDTIFEMRYFSVLVSMLTIALAYRMGKAYFGERAGVLTALFMALHDLVRALTHEVRHYPQQFLMVTLTLWTYWRFWKDPNRRRMIAFVLSGTALIYTHYWGGFVLMMLAIHALITRRDHLRRMVVAFVVIGLLYIPWLPVLYNQITLERPGGLPHALENSRRVYSVLTFQMLGVPEWFWFVLAMIGIMGAFGARPIRWRPSPATLAPALVAIVIPPLSILINTAYPTLSIRSLAVIVPALMLLAAHGLAGFRKREQLAVLAFILLYSLTTTSSGPVDRAPWEAVAGYLAARADSTDVVLLELDTDEYAVAYYLSQTGGDVDYAHSETTRSLHPEEYEAFMTEALAGVDGIWVAKLGWPGLPEEDDIRPELVGQGWTLTAPEIDLFGIYIDRPILLWRLDRPPVPEADPIVTYGESLRLMRAEADANPGGITLNMLWSPSEQPQREYTVSVVLFDAAGAVVTNADSRPLDDASSTTTWEPGGLYYDTRVLPGDFPAGTYRLAVQVYSFTDETFTGIDLLQADDCADDADCHYVIVAEVEVRD